MSNKYVINGIKILFNNEFDAALILSSIVIKNSDYSKSIGADKIRDSLIEGGCDLDNYNNLDKLINDTAKNDLILEHIKKASNEDVKEIKNAKVSLEDLPLSTDGSHVHNEINPYGLHRHEFKPDLTGSHNHPDGYHYHYIDKKDVYGYSQSIDGGAHTHAGSKNKHGTHEHDYVENAKLDEKLVDNAGSIQNGDINNGYPVILMKSGVASSGHYYPVDVMKNSEGAFVNDDKKPLRMFLNHASREEKTQGIRRTENICGFYKDIAISKNGNVEAKFFPAIGTPAGNLAKALLDNDTSIVDVSTVVLVGYRRLTNDEKISINNDNAHFIVEEIVNCASCDLVPDGGAGGEFIKAVQNAGYDFDNDGAILIKNDIENNGGVNQLDLTLDKLKADYPELYSDIVKNTKTEILGDLETKGKEGVLKAEISELKTEIEKSTENHKLEIDESKKNLEIAITEKIATETKIKRYENAVLANKIVADQMPTLAGKQRAYIVDQLLTCDTKENMDEKIKEFSDTFGDILKKNPVKNNGPSNPTDPDDDIEDDLKNLPIQSAKSLFNDNTGIKDGEYNSVKLND